MGLGCFKASLLVALPLYYLIVLVLVFTSFQHDATKLVFADEKLIEVECHNAEVPTACVQCVRSDPRGEKADKVGIATIVINCISKNAENLASNMSNLASIAGDKKLKAEFQDCQKGFLEAKQDLSRATTKLNNKDYDETNHFVRTALEQELLCKNNLIVGMKSKLPSNIVHDMNVYEQLSDAAMRIIDRF